ncbi:MAG TPA: SOS response-associated peptidase [Kofleriaceae bacterium]|jgi:putative SOS response-associated peptidase YedK|nr:SOS response-associated peptidase [Kofleriaceae bacterium]
MCGRYTVTKPEQIAEDLEAVLELAVTGDPWWKPRFNVAPTQPAPVVTAHVGGRGRQRTIELMRWGLVPHWADLAGKRPPLMINARLESLNAKQFFREALQRKRCLVPTDGFFEWVRAQPAGHKPKPPPKPFYFRPRARQLAAFAGLWARSTDEHGAELHSFTIITARASDLVRPIHDRMPIVLEPGAYDAWLDPAVDGEAARELLGEAGPGDWTREPVSTRVNKVDHDDPGCIAPDAESATAVQGRLFD